ncbi:GNAT family N-acetyltransferase [Micromonospora sp. AMSO12t]|uniref:GNAT family N-acetyltransferase n=1 Tax=unclassified Micromonospora TaxID=2617518 RepID=UPI00124B3C22|nr:GNAT family N-acetyltransferase [Micromonospora sp. AMSO12t]KAB1152046.1 GNAT family N-acetyltransferase [Micromonospora sp. AMSO12t]
MVELVPMTAEEFARVREPLVRSYAEAMVTDRGLAPATALERATTQLREQLPDGVDSAGALLRTARVGDVEVGWIWVGLPGGPAGPHTAWLNSVEVHPGHRRQGYGRRMIQLVEAELAALGVPELGLNVFGSNTGAIHLYHDLGYRVAAQQMTKRISPAG